MGIFHHCLPSRPTSQLPSLQGDGGGPLACLVDGSHVLAGITSWSVECGRQGAPPAVFASTTSVLEFIQRSTGAAAAPISTSTSTSGVQRGSRPDRSATYGR